MKLQVALASLFVLSACGTSPTRLTAESEQTRSAIAAHRKCAAKNLDGLLDAGASGSFAERAVAAEKPCIFEREALRNAIESENRAAMEKDRYSKLQVAGFTDASIRFTQEGLWRDLAFAQTQRTVPMSVSASGIHCSAVRPIFPSSIARDRTFSTAVVTAQVEILSTGIVESVVMISSSGYRDLDAAVFEALMQMKCDERPNASKTVVAKQHFEFKLE